MPALAMLRSEPRMIPRAPRHDVDLTADIEGPTILPFSSPVKNISASGMLLLESGLLRVGDVVFAKLPGKAAMLCTVVRLRKDGGAGLKFENAALADGFWA